jgi:hypothetical protein
MYAENVDAQEEFFSISFPEGFSIQKTSPVEDFDIYSIVRDGKPYVMIYQGNQPDFPAIKNIKKKESTVFSAETLKIYSIWDGNNLFSRELIIKIQDDNWPQYLHAWIQPHSGDILLADRILLSLKIRARSADM